MADELAAHLLALELALARRGLPAEALADLLADDFLEFGQSGRAWDREEVVEFLATTPPDPTVVLEGVRVDRLADDVALLTYVTSPGRTLRASIWVRRAGSWLLRFHQGTPAPPDGLQGP